MIKVRNVTIGEGIPKIIVPLVGTTDAELLEEVHNVLEVKPDIVEWRVDTYEDVENLEKVQSTLSLLRDRLIDIPILFTFRTVNEGGKREVPVRFYNNLLSMAIQSKLIDMVDIEFLLGDDLVKTLVSLAKQYGIYVVLSNHDFQKTPDKQELILRFRKMQELGADIPKIAVMPNSTEDVITLLEATNTMNCKYADRPFISVSMGGIGVISRLTGEVFGSAATFVSGIQESAPGQPTIKDTKKVLEILHKYSR